MAPGLLVNALAADQCPTSHDETRYTPSEEGSAAADIDWTPSLRNYLARSQRRIKGGKLRLHLPNRFPASVGHDHVWHGEDLSPREFIRELSKSEVQAIEHGLAHFKGLNLELDDICPETFPLPALSALLNGVAHDVHNGRGVAILRGLDPTKYSLEDNIKIYAGVSSYIGETRGRQDMAGNILSEFHIKDVGATIAPDDKRQSPYANNAQPFHNDLGDIIAMYCMDKAATGGVSKLASAGQVYNQLAASRPDLLCELAAAEWAFDSHEHIRPTYYKRPILFQHEASGRVFFCFSRRQLTGSTAAPRPAHFPKLTDAQAEALDAVHFTAARQATSVQLQKGDMQFVNNLAILHAREAFTDGPDSSKRHLIRMWLRNEKLAWPTPEGLRRRWYDIYGEGLRTIWHLSATHDQAHVINRRKSCFG